MLARGALAQGAALADGEITSETLVLACCEAIDTLNPALNAVIFLDRKGALQAAREADARRASGVCLGPFDGLPFGVKDNTDVAGMPTTGGLGPQPGRAPATADAPAVARLRAAGAIPLAKLNLHEAALGASNHNFHLGHCYNPLQPGFSPGGSSGGSAAAVSAGLVSFALGTDTMGSLRIPAAYCGCIGFKASFGRISTGGTLVVSRRLDHLGPIVRDLADLPPLLSLLSHHEPCDPASRAYPPCPQPDGAVARPLRLAFPSDLATVAVETSIEEAFHAVVEALRDAGHHLQPVSIGDLDLGAFRRAGLMVCEADMLSTSARWFDHEASVSPELRSLLDWVRGKSALDLARADNTIDQGARTLLSLLHGVDAYLSPTAPQLPFPMTAQVPPGQADLTNLANMAGVPAISLPMPLPDGALPAGFQLIGQLGADEQLLQIADRVVADSAGRLLREAVMPSHGVLQRDAGRN